MHPMHGVFSCVLDFSFIYTHVTRLCLIFLVHGFWKGTIVDMQTQFNGRYHISHLRDYIFPKEDTIFEGMYLEDRLMGDRRTV